MSVEQLGIPFHNLYSYESGRLLTINGITKCTKEWSEHEGVTTKYYTVCKRLENGWSEEDAVFKQTRHIRRKSKG